MIMTTCWMLWIDPATQAVHAAQFLDGLVDAPEHAVAAVPEELRLQATSHELAGDRVDALRARPGTRADDALKSPPAEKQPDAVIDRPASGQAPVAHAREPDRQALGLAVGVDRQRPLEQAQPAHRRGGAARTRHPSLKPAHRTGAEPGEHGACPPRLHEQAVEPVRLPDREQVAHRSAADVDDVLGKHDLRQRALGVAEPEQGDVLGHAHAVREPRLEGVDLRRRVSGGGRQEQDARLVGSRETEHEVVEQRVGRLHREAAAAHREDEPVLDTGGRWAHAATGFGVTGGRAAALCAVGLREPPPFGVVADRLGLAARESGAATPSPR